MKFSTIVTLVLLSFCCSAAGSDDEPKHQIDVSDESLVYVALQYTSDVNIHRMGGETENTIVLSRDGSMELVYGADGNLIKSCLNQGSANFANPRLDPIGHFQKDTWPWLKWGNCEEDPSTITERANAWAFDFEIGFRRALAERLDLKTYSNVRQRRLRRSKTVSMLIEALSASEAIFSNFLDPKYAISDGEIAELMSSLVKGIRNELGDKDAA